MRPCTWKKNGRITPRIKAPQRGQWNMRKPSRRHGLDMRNLLSTLAMWTPHPPTPSRHHDHTGSKRCQGVAGFGTTPSIGHNANTTTVDPTGCSIDAETIPSCGQWTQNLVEVLVDNTKGSDHRGDEGKQEVGFPGCWVGGTSKSTRQP